MSWRESDSQADKKNTNQMVTNAEYIQTILDNDQARTLIYCNINKLNFN